MIAIDDYVVSEDGISVSEDCFQWEKRAHVSGDGKVFLIHCRLWWILISHRYFFVLFRSQLLLHHIHRYRVVHIPLRLWSLRVLSIFIRVSWSLQDSEVYSPSLLSHCSRRVNASSGKTLTTPLFRLRRTYDGPSSQQSFHIPVRNRLYWEDNFYLSWYQHNRNNSHLRRHWKNSRGFWNYPSTWCKMHTNSHWVL